MESFPIPANAPPTLEQAKAALAEQDALQAHVLGSLGGTVAGALGTQGQAVAKLASKLQGAATSRVGLQQQLSDQVVTNLGVAANALLQAQQARMNEVAGRVVASTLTPAANAPVEATGAQPTGSPPIGTVKYLGGDQWVQRVEGGWVDIPSPGKGPIPPEPVQPVPQPGVAPIPPDQGIPPVIVVGGVPPIPPVQPVPGGPIPNPFQPPPIQPPVFPPGRRPLPTQPTPPIDEYGYPAAPSAVGLVDRPAPTPVVLRQPGGPSTGPSPPGGSSPVPPPEPPPQPQPGGSTGTPAPVPGTPRPPSTTNVTIPPCPPPNIYVQIPPCPPCAPVVAQGTTSPPPPPPEPPPVVSPEEGGAPPFTVATCPDLAPLLAAIPLPGSEEWCKAMPKIRDLLSEFGQSIVRWACLPIEKAYPLIFGLALDIGKVEASAPEWVVPLIEGIRRAVMFGWRLVGFMDRVCTCLKAIASLKGACAPSTLLGLAAVRAFIAAMKGVEFGVEMPVRLTVNLGIAFTQVDRILDYVTEYSCPTLIPGIGDAISSYSQGQIDYATFSCWMLCAGADPGVWGPVVIARAQHLDAKQVIELGRRAGLKDDAIAVQLSQRGWLRGPDRTGEQILYDKLPTLSEIEHWAGKGALNAGFVARWGLDTGFGELWASDWGTALRAQGVTQDVAQHQWRAHWKVPGESQAREFLYRLRPGRPGVTVPFTDADFVQMVGSLDAAPGYKQLLIETRYREVAPQLSGQLAARGLAPDSTIQDGFASMGYAPADAARLARLEKVRSLQALDASVLGYTPKTLANMVRLGIINQTESYVWFTRWGYFQSESDEATRASINAYETQLRNRYNRLAQRKVLTNVQKAYQVGTLSHEKAKSALVALGVQAATSEVILQTTDAAFIAQLAGQMISHTKSAFLKAQITREQAHTALITAGIVEPRASQYVASWAAELKTPTKLLTAAEVLRYFSDGLMTREQAMTRLRTLGYQNPDAQLKLRDAALKILARRVKVEQSIAWPSSSAQGTLVSLAADARAQAEELMRASEKDAPVKEIRRYYEAGAITPQYAMDLLTAYGYTTSAAERVITTWTVGGIGAAEGEAKAEAKGGHAGHP